MKIATVSTQVFHPTHIFTGKFVSAAFWFNKQDKLSRHKLIATTLFFS